MRIMLKTLVDAESLTYKERGLRRVILIVHSCVLGARRRNKTYFRGRGSPCIQLVVVYYDNN